MRKIKWGVLGAAAICERSTFAGMQQAENCLLYAIASRDLKKAEQFQQKYGFQKAYGSYEALLADPQVEAVYIPLPNHLHYEWSIKAMQKGKHVLCEKPLTGSEQQAREMFAVAKQHNVFLMEAFAYLHSPFIAALQQEIASGSIGELRFVKSSFYISVPSSDNIRMYRDMLGGSVYDLGVYSSSLILSLIEGEPRNVKAIASFNEAGVDILASVILEYADGVKAGFGCGMILEEGRDGRSDHFAIYGSKGYISSSNFTFNGDGELEYTLHRYDGDTESKRVSCPQNYRLEVEQLGRCAAGEATSVVSPEFSLRNARLIDRILEAIDY